MPDVGALTALGQEALLLSIAVSLPVVGVAAVTGLVVAVLQAATQIQESTLQVVPRVLAVFIALAVCGSWMLRAAVEFTTGLLAQMPGLAK